MFFNKREPNGSLYCGAVIQVGGKEKLLKDFLSRFLGKEVKKKDDSATVKSACDAVKTDHSNTNKMSEKTR